MYVCIVLYVLCMLCIALFVLYCIAMYCILCIALFVLYCIAMYCILYIVLFVLYRTVFVVYVCMRGRAYSSSPILPGFGV